MIKRLFLFLPLILSGAETVRIEGDNLTGWGVCTAQGVVTVGHLIFEDSSWHCENGEPEWVIVDSKRDLICLQSDDAAGQPAKIVFPPGELAKGSVIRFDENNIVVRGLNTSKGDSGKPLLNSTGEVYALVVGRQKRDGETYTLGARLDNPVSGKRITIKEFRSWNTRYAALCDILKKLRQLPESSEDGTSRDRAALILKDIPLENTSPSRRLAAKHRETLNETVRIAAWLGLTPYGERMHRKTAYTPKRWQEQSKNASLVLDGPDWGIAGFCSPQKEWRWFSYCLKGPFAGSIMACDRK